MPIARSEAQQELNIGACDDDITIQYVAPGALLHWRVRIHK
jgi:hypothetical protein